jgi:hypothetical protein
VWIKALYVLFVICTAALVAVGIGVLLRVRRHLSQERSGVETPPEHPEPVEPEKDNEIK